MHFDIYVALAGLIVGFAVGLTGMGGGALMTPILVLIFGTPPLAAVSSDLVAALVMKPLGSLVHAGRGTVQWGLVRWLAIGSVPSAALGVVFLRVIGGGTRVQNFVSVTLGAVLLLAVVGLVVKTLIDSRRGTLSAVDRTATAPLRVRRGATLATGAVVGFIVGITSVGSGTLIIVTLLFLYPRLRGSQLVGTDLAQAIPMVGAAALAHILFGDFKLALTTAIIVGSTPGVVIGSLLSSRAPTGAIRAALSVVLVASGLKLVNVPTLWVGVALLVALVAVGAAWLASRRQRSLDLVGRVSEAGSRPLASIPASSAVAD